MDNIIRIKEKTLTYLNKLADAWGLGLPEELDIIIYEGSFSVYLAGNKFYISTLCGSESFPDDVVKNLLMRYYFLAVREPCVCRPLAAKNHDLGIMAMESICRKLCELTGESYMENDSIAAYHERLKDTAFAAELAEGIGRDVRIFTKAMWHECRLIEDNGCDLVLEQDDGRRMVVNKAEILDKLTLVRNV